MHQQVILLNGPSSSGKSTLANSLQRVIREKMNESYEIISIDDFLEMAAEQVIYEDDVFEISIELCDKALKVLNSKKSVIIDHVITSERIFNQLNENLSSYQIHMIHVTCPIDILRQREAERNNRCIGSAEASYDYLFPQEGYDLTVDTYRSTTEECSLQILELLL